MPLDGDLNITDDTRIRAAVPTLKYLLDNGAKVCLRGPGQQSLAAYPILSQHMPALAGRRGSLTW